MFPMEGLLVLLFVPAAYSQTTGMPLQAWLEICEDIVCNATSTCRPVDDFCEGARCTFPQCEPKVSKTGWCPPVQQLHSFRYNSFNCELMSEMSWVCQEDNICLGTDKCCPGGCAFKECQAAILPASTSASPSTRAPNVLPTTAVVPGFPRLLGPRGANPPKTYSTPLSGLTIPGPCIFGGCNSPISPTTTTPTPPVNPAPKIVLATTAYPGYSRLAPGVIIRQPGVKPAGLPGPSTKGKLRGSANPTLLAQGSSRPELPPPGTSVPVGPEPGAGRPALRDLGIVHGEIPALRPGQPYLQGSRPELVQAPGTENPLFSFLDIDAAPSLQGDSKPGICPAGQMNTWINIFCEYIGETMVTCTDDSECFGSMKCCPGRCNRRECMEAKHVNAATTGASARATSPGNGGVNGNGVTAAVRSTGGIASVLKTRVGSCPEARRPNLERFSEGRFGLMSLYVCNFLSNYHSRCMADSQCAPGHKCCPSQCGDHRCRTPVYIS